MVKIDLEMEAHLERIPKDQLDKYETQLVIKSIYQSVEEGNKYSKEALQAVLDRFLEPEIVNELLEGVKMFQIRD